MILRAIHLTMVRSYCCRPILGVIFLLTELTFTLRRFSLLVHIGYLKLSAYIYKNTSDPQDFFYFANCAAFFYKNSLDSFSNFCVIVDFRRLLRSFIGCHIDPLKSPPSHVTRKTTSGNLFSPFSILFSYSANILCLNATA